MSEFRLPSLGADMEDGTIVEWKIKPGDTVTKGDIVAEVETDKGTIEVEVFQSGTVASLLVEAGTRVPVGTPIAIILQPGEAAPPAAAPPPPSPQAPSEPAPESPPPAKPQPGGSPQPTGIRAVPAAKRLAQELGIDLATVTGTGEGGAVTKADVERAAAAAKPDRGAAMRKAIAAAMTRSNREIPHYYLSDHIDMTAALERLTAWNAEKPLAERMLSGALFLRAIALAAREFPEFNGFWRNDQFEPADRVNLGVAIALKTGGLVTPAIHDADQLDVNQLMTAMRDLIGRARAGSGALRSSEVTEATLTVTNLGDLGVESVYGVIYPPQVALVGVGTIVERPWVTGAAVVSRKVTHVTLAADHRASDGLRGAKFLAAIKRRLEIDLEDLFA
jgi:pyruvate dehydrogenase E2 component (dihydrolipoamide acetyltransferase)